MADTVTTQVLVNNARNLIIKFTNESDGTGESGVTKVDATSATYANMGVAPGIHLKVMRVQYDVNNGAVRMRWDASTDVDMLILGQGVGNHDYTFMGGLTVPVVAGATGSILFTTVGFVSGSSYSITLEMIKGVPQS